MANTKLSDRQRSALRQIHETNTTAGIPTNTLRSLKPFYVYDLNAHCPILAPTGRDIMHVCADCDTIKDDLSTDTDRMYNKLGKICDDCYEAEKHDTHNIASDIITELDSANPWDETVVIYMTYLPCINCSAVKPVLFNGTFLRHTREATADEIVHRGMIRVHCVGSGKMAPKASAQYT